jgi:hypothetical protein
VQGKRAARLDIFEKLAFYDDALRDGVHQARVIRAKNNALIIESIPIVALLSACRSGSTNKH